METIYIKKVEKLSKQLGSRIFTQIDINYNVCASINDLNISNGYTYTSNCGRGLTYEDACKDYINNLSNLEKGEFLLCNGSKVFLGL